MQIPASLAFALDPRRSLGMLTALGFATVVLISTPFLIPAIADSYETSLSLASLVSVTQLGGFAIASFTAGRRLSPSRIVLVAALILSIVANLGSVALPALPVLFVLRFASGLSLGTISWFAWSNAFGSQASMSRIAVVGPVIGFVGTPVIAILIDRFGVEGLFVLLAILPLVPLALALEIPTGERAPDRERNPAVPSARIILLGLTLFAVGGSAVFQLGVTIGQSELNLSTNMMSLAYSASSLAAIPAAGWKRSRGIPSIWIVLCAASAFFVASAFSPILFLGAILVWGFSYWMAVPAMFEVLAKASAFPDERAGDAQAVMAVGRVAGPFVGAALLDGPGNLALAGVGAGLLLCTAAAVYTIRVKTERSVATP